MYKFVTLFLLLMVMLLCGQDLMAVQPTIGNQAPMAVSNAIYWMTGFGVLIIFGILILWSIRSAQKEDYDPVIFTFITIIVITLSMGMFFGDMGGEGFFAHDVAKEGEIVSGYEWKVYGDDAGSPAHRSTQGVSYEVQRGWATLGAIYFFKIIDFGFALYIIPLIMFVGMLIAVLQAKKQRDYMHIVKHFAFVTIAGFLCLWPSVLLETNIDPNNGVKGLYFEDTTADLGFVVDSPRIAPFHAIVFNVGTDIAEQLGSRISFRDDGMRAKVLSASLKADLDPGTLRAYQEYSGACFTALRNAHMQPFMDVAKDPDIDYQRWYWHKFGIDGNSGRVAAMTADTVPLAMRHALSPYAGAAFMDLNVLRHLPTKVPHGLGSESRRMFFLAGLPKKHTWHANFHIGGGAMGFLKSATANSRYAENLYNPFEVSTLPGPMAKDMSDMSPTNASEQIYALYCSTGHTMPHVQGNGGGASWQDVIPLIPRDDSMPRIERSFVDSSDLLYYSAIGWDDIVRKQIADYYIGPGSIKNCRHATLDHRSQHQWGCLIANRYDYAGPVTEKYETLRQMQTWFNDNLRPDMMAELDSSLFSAGPLGLDKGHSRSTSQFQAWSTTYESNAIELNAYATFTDLYFMSPAIQSLIGLKEETRSRPGSGEVLEVKEGWVTALIEFLGLISPDMLGFLSFIADILAHLIMMVYADVFGLMTFFAILLAIPFSIMAMLPGKAHMLIDWVKISLPICFAPVFQQVGISWIEKGEGFGMAQFFIMAQNGGGSIASLMLTFFGVLFVMSSYSLANSFLWASLSGGMDIMRMVHSSIFRLVGAAGTTFLTVGALAYAGHVGRSATNKASKSLKQSAVKGLNNNSDSDSKNIGNGGAGNKFTEKDIPQKLNNEIDNASKEIGNDYKNSVNNASNTLGKTAAAGFTALGTDGQPLAQGMITGQGIGQGLAKSIADVKQTRDKMKRMGNLGSSLEGGGGSGSTEASSEEQSQIHSQLGDDFLRNGSLEKDNGNIEEGNFYHTEAGNEYSLAGDKADTSLSAAEQYSNAARAYGMSGNMQEMKNHQKLALTALKNADSQGEHQGRIGHMRAQLGGLGMLEAHKSGNMPTAVKEFNNANDGFNSANMAYQNDYAESFSIANESGMTEDWEKVGSSLYAQLSSANYIDELNTYAEEHDIGMAPHNNVTDFMEMQTDGLRELASNGNKHAAAVMGGLLTTSGNQSEGDMYFKQAGVELSVDDRLELKNGMANNDQRMMKSILGRL